MRSLTQFVGVALPLFVSQTLGLNFTIANGQIFTPGFAILDAPQPGTPLGGGMSSFPFHTVTRDSSRVYGQLFQNKGD